MRKRLRKKWRRLKKRYLLWHYGRCDYHHNGAVGTGMLLIDGVERCTKHKGHEGNHLLKTRVEEWEL